MIADFKVLLDSCVLAVTNQEKDRHVLAAAVNEKLDIIITFNLRDFEIQHLEKWGVKAVHPDAYLVTLSEINPDHVRLMRMLAHQISRQSVLLAL